MDMMTEAGTNRFAVLNDGNVVFILIIENDGQGLGVVMVTSTPEVREGELAAFIFDDVVEFATVH